MQEVKRIREERGLSQAKLAARSGLNPVTINRIEHGDRSPTVTTLEKLADALECEVSDFFPKSQSPLWLEPQAGASGVYEDAIVRWADRVQKELESRTISSESAAGLLQSASMLSEELSEHLSAYLDPDPPEAAGEADWVIVSGLPKEDRRGIEEVTQLLSKVADTKQASGDDA